MKEDGMPQAGELYYFENEGREGGKTHGNPLVLIHGVGGHHLHWPHALRRLAGVHVFALDLPGHGKSRGLGQQRIGDYARVVVSWLRAMQLRQVALVGHSMGGAIAQQIALDHPEHVRALALVGTGARLPVNPDLLEKVARPQSYAAAVDLIIKWSYAPQSSARLKAQVRKAMLEMRSSAMYNDMLACQTFDSRERLAELRVPTAVVVGAEDKMTPARLSEALRDGIEGATLEVIRDAGHMVALEQPEATARAIAALMARVAD